MSVDCHYQVIASYLLLMGPDSQKLKKESHKPPEHKIESEPLGMHTQQAPPLR